MPFYALVVLTWHFINRHVVEGVRLSALSVVAALVVWFGYLNISFGLGNSILVMLGALALMLFGISLCYAWFAVRWHRFLILSEPQHPLATNMPLDTFTRYGWRMFRLAFGLMLLTAFVLIFLDSLFRPGDAVHSVMSLTGWFLTYYVFLRISPILPGIALNRVPRLWEAWRATRTQKGAIFVLAALLYALTIGIQYLIPVEGAFASPLDAVFVFVTFWVQVLIHASALTAIYHGGTVRR